MLYTVLHPFGKPPLPGGRIPNTYGMDVALMNNFIKSLGKYKQNNTALRIIYE